MSALPISPAPRLLICSALWLNCLFLTQCKKNAVAPALPPESTSGANKSGCLVDGQVLVPRDARGRSGTNLALRLSKTAEDAIFSLSLADQEASSGPYVEIQADSLVLEEGKSYSFSASPHRGVVQGNCFTTDGGVYTTTTAASGTLTITRLDRPAKLLAGRFEFVGTDKATGKQVHVTAGRFDFQDQ